MAGELNIRKLYIDSRFKTVNSSSDGDFKFELNEAIQLPDNCAVFIDDITIPNSWYNIDSQSNRLYVRRYQDASNTRTDKILSLDIQNHTFTTLTNALQTALDDSFGSNIFTVTQNVFLGTMSIEVGPDSVCRFFTDSELKEGNITWYGDSYDISNLMSANEVCGIFVPQGGNLITTSLVDLRRYHNIYLSSSSLSSYSTLGPLGQNDIIKKIQVTSNYGSMIFDNVVAPHDWVDVSKRLLKTLEFKFIDAYGKTINFNGISVSFSLIFMIVPHGQ